MQPVLETRDLTIRFGGQVAVDAVSLAFHTGTLTAMRALDATVPSFFVLIACGLLAFYPLSKTTMHRLRRILEWRRARASMP